MFLVDLSPSTRHIARSVSPALEPLYHSQLRNHLHGITTTLHSPRFNNSQNLVTWLLKVASNNTPSNWPEPSNLHQQSLQVSHQAHPRLCKRTSPVASHSSTLCTHETRARKSRAPGTRLLSSREHCSHPFGASRALQQDRLRPSLALPGCLTQHNSRSFSANRIDFGAQIDAPELLLNLLDLVHGEVGS